MMRRKLIIIKCPRKMQIFPGRPGKSPRSPRSPGLSVNDGNSKTKDKRYGMMMCKVGQCAQFRYLFSSWSEEVLIYKYTYCVRCL